MQDVTVVFNGYRLEIDEAFFDADMLDELDAYYLKQLEPTEQDIISALDLC